MNKDCLDHHIYYIHFEITCDPCILIGSRRCDLFTNHTILCSKSHLFPSQWDSFTKTQLPIKSQGLFKEINHIVGKWETTFATFNKLKKLVLSIWILRFQKDAIRKKENFFSCNFILKLYSWFQITGMLMDQIALHWVQLPLLIIAFFNSFFTPTILAAWHFSIDKYNTYFLSNNFLVTTSSFEVLFEETSQVLSSLKNDVTIPYTLL